MSNLSNVTQRLCRAAIFGGALAAMLFTLSGRGEEVRAKNPRDLIAGYLHRFPHYVEWPTTNQPATNLPPWRIAVLGDDPFGESLIITCAGKPVDGRSFEIIRAVNVADLPACDIVFLTAKTPDELKAQLAALANRPVLTVGEHSDFLKLGGMIQMVQMEGGSSMRFSVNLDQVRASKLKIQVPMLEMATQIIENGRRKK